MNTTGREYDDLTPCPECGTEDAEYGVHNDGCPSGYPTVTDTDFDAAREFEDEHRVGPF